jgi:hypothetical protein
MQVINYSPHRVNYDDGVTLTLVPIVNEDRLGATRGGARCIDRVDATLYRNGVLAAYALPHGQVFVRFWSRGEVSQKQFADYLEQLLALEGEIEKKGTGDDFSKVPWQFFLEDLQSTKFTREELAKGKGSPFDVKESYFEKYCKVPIKIK